MRILIGGKETKHLKKGRAACRCGCGHRGVVGQMQRIGRQRVGVCRLRVADAAQTAPIVSVAQRMCQQGHGALAHAVNQDVGLGVEEHGAAHGVGPVIVVRDAPQAGLDATDNDGAAGFECASDQIAIRNDRAVRTHVIDAAGREVVLSPLLASRRVVGDHRVDTTTGNSPEEARLAETADVIETRDIGLGNDGGAKARRQ